MRRKDREITDREELLDIMQRCDVCRLALNDDGYPYIVPPDRRERPRVMEI